MTVVAKSPQDIQTILRGLGAEAQAILGKYDQKRAALLPLLHLAQERIGHVSPEVEEWAAELVETTPAHVHEVVTFYTLYHQHPIGKHHIQVCSNMSCVLRGADEIIRHLEDRLGIKAGQTTKDGMFTLSSVECLCACEIAPMLQVNDRYVGPLTKESVDRLIDECRRNQQRA